MNLNSPSVACGAYSLPITADDFEWIVPQHQKRIFRILLPLVGDSDTAETLTQECFLRAFVKSSSFRGEARLESWLTRIAINLACDHLRNRRLAFWRRLVRGDAIRDLPENGACRSPEHTLLAREKSAILLAAVGRLPLRQRTAFVLRYAEEMPLEQVAEIMRLEVGTVKTHLFRALAALRSAVGE